MLIPLLNPKAPSVYIEHSRIIEIAIEEVLEFDPEEPHKFTHNLKVIYQKTDRDSAWYSWKCTKKRAQEFAKEIYEACRFATLEEANVGKNNND